MSTLTRENLQEFCRTCLKNLNKDNRPKKAKQEEQPLWYHIEQTFDLCKWMHIVKPLRNIKAIATVLQQQYPQYVCHQCYEKFRKLFIFQEMIGNSCNVLDKLLTSEEQQQPEGFIINEVFIKPEPDDDDHQHHYENDLKMEELLIKTEDEDFKEDKEDDDDAEDDGIDYTNNKIKFEAQDTEFIEPSILNQAEAAQLIEEVEGQPKAIKSYKCPQCNISYIHKYTYIAHIRQAHLGIERAFECEICHKKYTKFCNLYRHMRLEHGESLRQFKCEYANCNRSFRQLSTRRKHYEEFHNHEPVPSLAEKVSLEYLKQEQIQQAKVAMVNPLASTADITDNEIESYSTNSNKRICPVCTSCFDTSYDLKVHMNQSHQDEMKFACQICGKQKISQMKLEEHIATVHENPRVICEICQKVLKCKSHLRQHILSVHNGAKPYACEYCPSTFAAKNTLKVHTRIHTGEKPFKCSVCDRRFRQLTPMKKHLETHEKGRRNAVMAD